VAQPITFHRTLNGAAHVGANLPTAAGEHADAVESAYEILQLLHDRGVLDLIRGLLGAGDQVIDTLVEPIDTPEAVRGIRNFLLLTKFFGSIRPEVLNSLAQAATEGAEREVSQGARVFPAVPQTAQREYQTRSRGDVGPDRECGERPVTI